MVTKKSLTDASKVGRLIFSDRGYWWVSYRVAVGVTRMPGYLAKYS